jgi:hypothetical protein
MPGTLKQLWGKDEEPPELANKAWTSATEDKEATKEIILNLEQQKTIS